ncbi:MAG: hypothetical protein K6A90_07125 [Lachnospiraceae bacterium]|nr:hypothetical protein [Lachnospiraceae bacterium]
MKINKEIVEKFVRDNIDSWSDIFDEYESDHEFDFGDFSDSCSKVSTSSFGVTIKHFEVEIEKNDGSVWVNGTSEVSYTIKGFEMEGDDDPCGYVECGKDEECAEISFTIDVDTSDFEKSELTDVDIK